MARNIRNIALMNKRSKVLQLACTMMLCFFCMTINTIVNCTYATSPNENINLAQPITLNVVNAPLQEVVLGISKSHHLDVIGLESLEGTVTARLNGLDAVDVIRQLGELKHFTVRQEQSVLIIDGYGKSEEQRQLMVLEPSYMRPETLESALQGVVPNERMTVVKERNQVHVYGTPRETYAIQSVMPRIDTEPKQVQLEATIIAMESSFVKEVGLKWSWLSLTSHGEDTTNSYGSIQFGKLSDGSSYKFFYKPELSAMETSGKAAIIARPSIMTMNGEEAKILIGERIPVVEETRSDGERYSSVRYEDVGIRLTYTPYVGIDNTVDATINAEVSSPTLVPEMKAYKITAREAKTRVRMKPGEVLVIGGLMDNRNQKQLEKIPLLGDIPLVGKLFRHSRKTKDTVEMVILVKATVV